MTPFDYCKFVNQHPLRYLCNDSPVDVLKKHAFFLADRSIEYLSQWYTIPISEDMLNEILSSRNIIIGKQKKPLVIEHYSWHFLAWYDPDRNCIHLNEEALEKLAESGTGMPDYQDLSIQKIRMILISHELFHMLYHEIRKPLEWESLKKAEQIIIEEIAARIFSVCLTQISLNPFILDELIHNSIIS